MMKKRFMTAAFTTVMALALPFAAQAGDIRSEYGALLAPYTDNLDQYALYDFNGDGILELLVDPGVTNPMRTYNVYTYDGATVKNLGSFSGRGAELYVSSSGKLIKEKIASGWVMLYEVALSGGEFTETKLVEKNMMTGGDLAALEASYGMTKIEHYTSDLAPLAALSAGTQIAAQAPAQTGASGWVQDGSGWRYGKGDGSFQQTGWFQDADGSYYYFGADGYMLSSTTTPDGYQVDGSGRWVK